MRREPFGSAEESASYLEWRFGEYPLFREFSGLWGDHDGQVVLDYGCGPGNDVVGFLIHTGARKVIGIDISASALELARERIVLHEVDPDRFELIQASDTETAIPLTDGSVDFFQSQGVLHHTSEPLAILRELRRVSKTGGQGRMMVYNRDSLWLHLYTAYEIKIRQGRYPELTTRRPSSTPPTARIARSPAATPPKSSSPSAPKPGSRPAPRRLPVAARARAARQLRRAGDRR